MKDSPCDLGSIWVRVDDRLIHGQVTVGWRQHLRYAEIWVVDDQACGDPHLQDALRLAAPEGVTVRVYEVGEAVVLLRPPPAPSEWRHRLRAVGPGEGATDLPPGRIPFSGHQGGPDRIPTLRGASARGGAQGCAVLLLVRSPEVASALVEGGVALERLNVGNLSSRPGSVRAFKNISLTPAHVEALDALAARGVRITFQLTPEDPQADWPSVRRRLTRRKAN